MPAWDQVSQGLQRRFAGELLTPADPDYEMRRRVWNGMVDRRPLLIARCASEDDVVAAVAAAREHGLPVAVRGGGHNVAGNALCDPAESETHMTWARDLFAAMQAHATGVYVNNLGVEGAARVKAAYAPNTYERLVALKDRYDPRNVFRLNQNIAPTSTMSRR
jgi:FAD/FMN-containing dehydrogenase